jgi:hypothetical protein
MPRIGVYSVDSTELTKPPEEREYEQKGLYDSGMKAWVNDTDSRVKCLLPDEDGEEYSFNTIQKTVESATTHVYLEGEVPGTVSQPATSNCFSPASD